MHSGGLIISNIFPACLNKLRVLDSLFLSQVIKTKSHQKHNLRRLHRHNTRKTKKLVKSQTIKITRTTRTIKIKKPPLPKIKTSRKRKQRFQPLKEKLNQRSKNNNNHQRRRLKKAFLTCQSWTSELERSLNAWPILIQIKFTWKR